MTTSFLDDRNYALSVGLPPRASTINFSLTLPTTFTTQHCSSAAAASSSSDSIIDRVSPSPLDSRGPAACIVVCPTAQRRFLAFEVAMVPGGAVSISRTVDSRGDATNDHFEGGLPLAAFVNEKGLPRPVNMTLEVLFRSDECHVALIMEDPSSNSDDHDHDPTSLKNRKEIRCKFPLDSLLLDMKQQGWDCHFAESMVRPASPLQLPHQSGQVLWSVFSTAPRVLPRQPASIPPTPAPPVRVNPFLPPQPQQQQQQVGGFGSRVYPSLPNGQQVPPGMAFHVPGYPPCGFPPFMMGGYPQQQQQQQQMPPPPPPPTDLSMQVWQHMMASQKQTMAAQQQQMQRQMMAARQQQQQQQMPSKIVEDHTQLLHHDDDDEHSPLLAQQQQSKKIALDDFFTPRSGSNSSSSSDSDSDSSVDVVQTRGPVVGSVVHGQPPQEQQHEIATGRIVDDSASSLAMPAPMSHHHHQHQQQAAAAAHTAAHDAAAVKAAQKAERAMRKTQRKAFKEEIKKQEKKDKSKKEKKEKKSK